MNKLIYVFGLSLMTEQAISQDTTKKGNFEWSVFADVYYSYDFNKPANHEKPSFLYNHNRHNEFNVNLALITASYEANNIRAKVGLMAGTYPQYNLAAEPELLKNIFEANVGVKISKSANVWIDAGVLPSHIGYESAISKDNWTLTRSIPAENSPYYETGVKITFTDKSEKLLLSGLLLNGWQHIRRPDGNNTPAFCSQLTYTPNSKLTLNWSTFIGNEQPDSAKRWRYFNDLYVIFRATEKVGVIAGFDIGIEQNAKGSSKMHTWYSPSLILQYKWNKNWAMAARAEYFSDPNGVIIVTGTDNGFKTFGASLNLDRCIGENFLWRTEIRTFNSKDSIFLKPKDATKNDMCVTTSFAISF